MKNSELLKLTIIKLQIVNGWIVTSLAGEATNFFFSFLLVVVGGWCVMDGLDLKR